MAPKYTLNYFNFTGRAEPARMMFKLSGTEFTDNQITFGGVNPIGGQAWWDFKAANKDRFPLQTIPTLEIADSAVITGSWCIFRYLANEFNLYGENSMDKAVIDQIGEPIQETFEETTAMNFIPCTPEEKQKKFQDFFASDRIKLRLEFVQKKLKDYKPGPFLLGGKISMGDCVFYGILEYWFYAQPALKEQYPEFLQLFEAVSKVDPIANHLATRKQGLAPPS